MAERSRALALATKALGGILSDMRRELPISINFNVSAQHSKAAFREGGVELTMPSSVLCSTSSGAIGRAGGAMPV